MNTRRGCLHKVLTEEEGIKLRVIVRHKRKVKVKLVAGGTGRSDIIGGG